MKTSILASLAIIFISITHIFAILPELNTYDSFLDKNTLSKKQLSKGSKNKPIKKNITPHRYNYRPNKSTIRDKKLKSKKVDSKENKKLKIKKDSQNKKLQGKKNIKLKKGVQEKKVKETKVGVKKVKDKGVKDKSVKNKTVKDKALKDKIVKNKKEKKDLDGRGANNRAFNFTKTHKTKKRNELIDSAIKGGIDLVTPLGALNFSDLSSEDDSADKDNDFDIDEDDDKEYNKKDDEDDDESDEYNKKEDDDENDEYSKKDEDGKNDLVDDKDDIEEDDRDYSGDGGSDDQDEDRTYYDSDQDESRNVATSLDDDQDNEENAVGLDEEENAVGLDNEDEDGDDYNQGRGEGSTSDLTSDCIIECHKKMTKNTKQSKYKIRETNISYINGMGVGYDITKGNPFGDIDSLIDPGYKYPVIVQKIKKCPNNISRCFNLNSILSIPSGIWVRKLSNCAKQEKTINLSQINNSIQTKNVKNDVKLDIEIKGEEEDGGSLSFTSTILYDNLRRLGFGKNNNVHQHIVNCFKYLAGYDIPIDKLTHSIEFAQFIKSMPLEFISDDCTSEYYKINPKDSKCKSVDSWMKLFNVFGTHFVTLVFLGGKLIINQFDNDKQNIQINEDKAKVDVEVGVKATDLAINVDSNISNHSKDKEVQSSSSTYFMGGSMANPTENISLWYDSLSNHSMPIKITLEPLYLILPRELVKWYKLAYKYYVE